MWWLYIQKLFHIPLSSDQRVWFPVPTTAEVLHPFLSIFDRRQYCVSLVAPPLIISTPFVIRNNTVSIEHSVVNSSALLLAVAKYITRPTVRKILKELFIVVTTYGYFHSHFAQWPFSIPIVYIRSLLKQIAAYGFSTTQSVLAMD